jgi:dynein heavy chain
MMRALRDSNVTKFVNADVGIFLGLVNDIFPKMQDATKQADPIMTKAVRDVLKENKVFIKNGYQEGLQLQPEYIFVGKTVDLAELLGIRHCVFALGCAGSGKTCVWKTLQAAQTHLAINPATRTPAVGDGPTLVNALNPKAVTSDDLYGFVHPVTKEPFDGIIAKIMRDFKNATGAQLNVPKWVMLDGDIDAEWIESMNTVMDDNRLLTLANSDRIPMLRPNVTLHFEVEDLRNASPATVSRAGIIYVSEEDLGYMPYVTSWLTSRTKDGKDLTPIFDKYTAPLLNFIRIECQSKMSIANISLCTSCSTLLDALLGALHARCFEEDLATLLARIHLEGVARLASNDCGLNWLGALVAALRDGHRASALGTRATAERSGR